jgi:proline dehydrogenase
VSAFIPISRAAFLYLSKQKQLRRWVETSPGAARFTSRFIAGLNLEDGVRAVRELSAARRLASLDYLGENVTALEEARSARDEYLAALQRVAPFESTISGKLTSLGLDISEAACEENTDTIVSEARRLGTRVEFDMEDSSYTDRTLRIVHALHQRHGGVRAVIQAYLYRSESDIEELCRRGVPVRLCKGAYREPQSVAWANKRDVDENFLKLMRMLFERGTYPAIATHDETMVNAAIARGNPPDSFEFQMLYGVRRMLQKRVVNEGYRLRVYVPYGTAWYPYFMRRLAERPANVWFILRNSLRG